MKVKLKAILASLVVAGVFLSASVSRAADIVDTAVAAGSFKTLATALEAAELVDALKGEGPFTVFAPTDEAFAKLPAGTVDTLLKPGNKDRLTAILTYHVVSGRVPASKVVELSGAKTLNGQRVDIATSSDGVTVDGARVVKTDIECFNGVIHVIDRVILPSEDNLAKTAQQAGAFNTLVAAAQAAGLVGALTGSDPLTVFAPTDDAFGKLPAGTVESLLRPENREKLTAILKYHIVPGRVYSEDALAARSAETLQGAKVEIAVSNGKARVNKATLVKTDLDASNGVIHIIDSVLLPPENNDLSAGEARGVIEDAIARGAHTFNAGHHEQCAQIYMNTMNDLVSRSGLMPAGVVNNMRTVMTQAANTQCPTQRAWTLRHGLDRAYWQMAQSH